jgi:hypothetical protein
MATLKADIKTAITAVTTAILTGGIFDSNEIYADNDTDGGGYDWASQNGVTESNGVTLKPHGIIRWREANAYQIDSPKLAAEREFFEIFLYQDMGYAVIDAAKVAIKAALHDKIYYPSDRQLASLQFVTFSTELKAPEYQHKPMKFLRFSVIGR